jgi:hypothetical protein
MPFRRRRDLQGLQSAARQHRAAAPAVRCPWTPLTGRAGPVSRRAGRRSCTAGEGTRPIIMPSAAPGASLQFTGQADLWHPTGTEPGAGQPERRPVPGSVERAGLLDRGYDLQHRDLMARTSHHVSRAKIRYSKRIDTADRHARRPRRISIHRSHALADFWYPYRAHRLEY